MARSIGAKQITTVDIGAMESDTYAALLDIGAIEAGGLDLGAIESTDSPNVTAAPADTISLSDSAVSFAIVPKTAADSYTLSDLVTAFGGGGSFDQLPLYDEIFYTISYGGGAPPFPTSLAVGDALTLEDAVLYSTFGFPQIQVGDTLVLNDDINSKGTYGLSLGDSYTLGDSLGSQSPKGISIVDSLSLGDIFSAGTAGPLWFSDSYTLSDSFSLILEDVPPTPILISAGDSLYFLDQFIPYSPSEFGGFVDALFLRDYIRVHLNSTRDGYLRRYLNDAVLLSDSDGTVGAAAGSSAGPVRRSGRG